jgi:hypothetical protein
MSANRSLPEEYPMAAGQCSISGIELQSTTKGTYEAQFADRIVRNNPCTSFPPFVAPMPVTFTPDERRALELIAAEPIGCPEHLLVSRGYSVDFLAGLVQSGLASVTAENIGPGPTARTVFRLWITKRGQQTLQAGGRP